ncbi:MAG: hypothetical protein KDD64_03790 [Bdellovibrionales bacterium]|nr:hypothetical protein [Bdellovibrionales bacterium]
MIISLVLVLVLSQLLLLILVLFLLLVLILLQINQQSANGRSALCNRFQYPAAAPDYCPKFLAVLALQSGLESEFRSDS